MLKHMAVLAGGTAIAQALSFAASPILSRLFTESDYGEFGVFTSIMAYLIVSSNLRLENAILLPKEDNEARALARWSLKFSSSIFLLTLIACLIAIFIFDAGWYYLLLAPTTFFNSVIQLLYFYSSRQKSYSKNSTGRIINSIGIAIASLLFGYLQFGATGLVLASFLGTGLACTYLLYHFRTIFKTTSYNLTWTELRKNYGDFIFVNTPHAILDLTESAGMIILMGLYFDKEYLGAYFFAYRILKTPLGLIGNAIYQVFFREVSVLVSSSKSVLHFFRKSALRLFLIASPIFIVLFLLGEKIFIVIFGTNWELAGRFSAILAPWFLLNFVASTLSFFPVVLKKQKQAFLINIISTALKVIVTLVCGFYFNFETLVMSYSIFFSCLMVFNLFWYQHIIENYELKSLTT